MATIGLRSRRSRLVRLDRLPAGLVLLLVVAFFDWIVLVLPAWVAVVSLFILRRERVTPGR